MVLSHSFLAWLSWFLNSNLSFIAYHIHFFKVLYIHVHALRYTEYPVMVNGSKQCTVQFGRPSTSVSFITQFLFAHQISAPATKVASSYRTSACTHCGGHDVISVLQVTQSGNVLYLESIAGPGVGPAMCS